MKALLTDNQGKLWLQEVAPPVCDEYDCLVRMEVCLFCHSTDRHIVEGTFLSPFHNPSILGHEGLGVIEAVGARVRHLAVGDRMPRVYAIYPGDVQDGIGSAWGGFAEWGKVRDAQAMVEDGVITETQVPGVCRYMQRIPADIPFEKSLLLITQKEIYSASQQITEVAGQRLLVAGAGITGCLFGLFLRWRGAHVTMVARRPEPLDFALAQGCADDVAVLGEDLASDYDGLVETTGSLEAATALAAAGLRPGGPIYSYAVYEGMGQPGFFADLEARHPFRRVDPAEATAHEAALEMIRDGRFDPAPFVTGRFPMDDWDPAWRSVTERTSLKTGIFFR